MRTFITYVACFMCLLATAAAQTTPILMAGVASVDITPWFPWRCTGMRIGSAACRTVFAMLSTRRLWCSGTRVVESRALRLYLGSIVSERLKNEVATKLNIPLLLLAASHTHSAPAFLPFGSAPVQDKSGEVFKAELERKIFNAVERASKSTFPARLAAGKGSIQLGYNRLKVQPDSRSGDVSQSREHPVRTGGSRAGAAAHRRHGRKASRVDGALCRARCGSRAEQLQVLSRLAGVMQSKVESDVPCAKVMFVQGGAGDTNPLFLGRSEDEATDFAVVQKMGEILAHPLFYGYTYSNDGNWAGYFPTCAPLRDVVMVPTPPPTLQLGVGEWIIEQHSVNLYGMQGMWRDKPRQR